MTDVTAEKSAEDLRREIEELQRQQREITERLRDPRGLRKVGNAGAGVRNAGAGAQRLLGRGGLQRGAVRRGDSIDAEDQPPMKKRLLSAVVKVEEHGDELGELETFEPEEDRDGAKPEEQKEARKQFLERGYGGGSREFRGGDRGFAGQENEPIEPLPRVMPKIDDPNVAKRNRRMFGALLGTLEKFRQEDKKLSGSEAFMRRSTSQKRAEQRAQEESERLRQQEREQLAGKRKRDLVLRARLAAKAEEKELEVLYIQWTEHHSKLSSFLRTKAEPAIFYLPAKPSEETDKLHQAGNEDLAEWKSQRRAELNDYQRQCTEDLLAKVQVDIERWQAGPQHGRSNDAPNNTALEMENVDGTGDGKIDRGKHGWHRTRLLKVSDNGEEDQEDEVVVGEEAKTESQHVAKASSPEVEVKEMDGKNVGRIEGGDDGALKYVLGYASGEGEGEMEER